MLHLGVWALRVEHSSGLGSMVAMVLEPDRMCRYVPVFTATALKQSLCGPCGQRVVGSPS